MERKLITKAIENPSRIPSFLRKQWRYSRYGQKIMDCYDGNDNPEKYVLITTPIRAVHTPNSQYYRRPNMWVEGYEIIRIFNRLGFAADIYDMGADIPVPKSIDKYDVIFGGGRNFRKFVDEAGEDTVSIYFSAGTHWNDTKKYYRHRIDYLQERKGIEYTPQRPELLEKRDPMSADAILSRGDSRARATWEKHSKNDVPVRAVPISHPPSGPINFDNQDYESTRKRFLWFGGNGLVLKGLDIVLDAFKDLSDVELYVCGPVSDSNQFKNIYSDALYEASNIHNVGWVEINSEKYEEITEKCGYMIYPSASEGMSGAVATCMWQGLVPIVTEQVYSSVGDWGDSVQDISISNVRRIIREASRRRPGEVRKMSKESYEYARGVHDREKVSEKIEYEIKQLLSECGLSTEHMFR